MEFIIISGVSGAGKSVALRSFEDLGFFCVDNLPPSLLATFYELCEKSKDEKMKKVAIVVDIRGANTFENVYTHMGDIREQDKNYKILFLTARPDTVLTRFKETRRIHPLSDAFPDRSIEKAIDLENRLMDRVRLHSDYIIDTSSMTNRQLKERITHMFGTAESGFLKATIMSFGFKYGIPLEADIIFDVRCLPNPYYVPELKDKTGLDKDVREYVLSSETSIEFIRRLTDLVDYSMPLYIKEGKSEIVIAVGCTGGKHRSVTVARLIHSRFSDELDNLNVNASIQHRDVFKS